MTGLRVIRAGPFYQAVTRFRRDLIEETLRTHGGNRTRAARALGMQRTYLVRLIKEYELPPATAPAERPPRQEVTR